MQHATKIPYPEPIPFPRMHRCGRPVTHSLVVVGLLAGWLWFSIATMGTWGLKVAAWLDPHKVGYGLPLAVFTEVFWLVALIPGGALMVYCLAMWRCTGARAHLQPLLADAFPASTLPQPTLVERMVIPDDVAARHGVPPGTIVERIHYR